MKSMRAENLQKHYGAGETAVCAIQDVSFDVEPGEFVAIMGESGSGKSTLLTILGGLNTPTSGRLFLDDLDIYALRQDERADFRREFVGFVFQSFHLIPYLTLAENVMLPLAIMKKSKGEKRDMAKRALEKVKLAGKEHRLPGEISGGEQERVAIARAVVNNPLLILADEPTGNLDSKTARGVMDLLRGLNAGGTTIIMVTHSNKYARYTSKILHLSDGRLVI